MRVATISRVTVILMITLLLTACFGLATNEDNSPHYYVLNVDRGAVATQFAKDRVLLVKPVKIIPYFRKKMLVFRIAENEYQPQINHQFFADPQQMMTDQLQRWLQKTGLFSQVVLDEREAEADMVLETAVTALYGDKRAQFSPQAVVEMQFFLLAEQQQGGQPLMQTGLKAELAITETTPAYVVKAWKQGLEELFATLEDDLSGYFSEREPL